MTIIHENNYIYKDYFEGNLNNNPKAPKTKKGVNQFSLVENKNFIIGALRDDIVMVDCDDMAIAQTIYNIILKEDTKCIVKRTTRGLHFYFKYNSKGVPNNKNKQGYCALGLECEHKLGLSNTRTLIKSNGKYRELIRVCSDNDMSELPVWLYYVGKHNPEIMGLKSGDGRNDKLFKHILSLTKVGIYKLNGGLYTMELINKYVIEDSIDKDEFDTITRDEAWKCSTFPYVNEKNKPLLVWQNLQYVLEGNRITSKYNVISKEIEMYGIDSNLDYDASITEINTICQNKGFKVSKDNLYSFNHRIAIANQYNPVTDYLLECKKNWDGTSRVMELYDTIDKVVDGELERMMFHKWLLNCAAMAFNKGKTQQQGILVIQGKQGIGKTRWIKSIVPNHDWALTGIQIEPSNKDSVMKSTKNWIVELGELEGMTSRKEQSNLKAFITSPSDVYREPYGRTNKEFIRHTCFYATVNEVEFLKDDTGNRRYWVIQATNMEANHNVDIDQLWGEITTQLLSGEIEYYLNNTEIEKLNIKNEEFRNVSPVEVKIRDGFKWDSSNLKWLSVTEIGENLNIPQNMYSQIGRHLNKFGVKNKRLSGGKYYHVPEFKAFKLYGRCN